MGNDIQVFNFQGDDLEVVRQGDDLFVSLRAVCSALGLDHAGQGVKLAKRGWAVVAMIATTGSDGMRYEMTGVHLDTLPLWLATISPSRVAEGVRPKLVAYQKQAASVLADHFLGRRGGLSPQGAEDMMRRIAAEVLAQQQGGALGMPTTNRGALRAVIEWARRSTHNFTLCKTRAGGGRDYISPDSGVVIGMWAAEGVAIVRSTLDPPVSAWGFDPAELYANWTRQGWASVDKQAKVFGVRRSGGRANAVVIRQSGWQAVEFSGCPVDGLS